MSRLHSADLACTLRRPASRTLPLGQRPADEGPIPAHRFFIPLHYEPNYAYPLLIWLHGPAAREAEINQVMPHVSLRNYVGMAVRGAVTQEVEGREQESFYSWSQDPDSVQYAAEDVLRCVALAKERFNIAPDRVFLVGNDVGGTMALRLALMLPHAFAGVASLGGRVPDTHAPLAGINQARSMPIMLAHGRESQVYPTADVCSDLRLLHVAGMSVCLRVYPCPQEVTTKMLSDVNAWMMEQIAGVPSDSHVIDDPTHVRLEDHN